MIVPFVSGGAVTRARHRLGAKPFEWLCQTSARAWVSEHNDGYLFKGMTLLSIDGTTLRTPDNDANRAHFGAQAYAKRTSSQRKKILAGVSSKAILTMQ